MVFPWSHLSPYTPGTAGRSWEESLKILGIDGNETLRRKFGGAGVGFAGRAARDPFFPWRDFRFHAPTFPRTFFGKRGRRARGPRSGRASRVPA